ncbi:MAG: sulfatase [Chitinophagales bacterium]|nr:sulfatase [Hyphomicrobiales bacterium]
MSFINVVSLTAKTFSCWACFIALSVVVAHGTALAQSPPNIVLIVTDDQRYDTLPYMPKVSALLAERGTEFTNAIITTPTCCPSRASILTGQYAHNHGIEQNEREFADKFRTRDSETLAAWLKAGGYRTALIGKYLNGYRFGYIPPGWDTFHAFAKRHYYNYRLTNFIDGAPGPPLTFGSTEEDYATDVLMRKALDFIRSSPSAGEKPFFLMLTPNAPHRPAIPARRHEQAYPDLQPHRPPSFNVSSKGFWDQKWWSKGGRTLSKNRIAKIDAMRRGMLQSLLAVDEGVEQIVNTLSAMNKLDNTVIIFLGGDNGFHWGEHRITDKRSPYEESIRTALIVFDGRIKVKRSSNGLVANIDLAPTILDLAGLKIPASVDGISLVPLMAGQESQVRKHLLIQIFAESFASTSNAFIGVRGTHSVYFERQGVWRINKEYYDMGKDIYQLENVIADFAKKTEVQESKTALERLRSCAGASCR